MRDYSRLLANLPAVLNDDEIRDAANLVARGEIRVAIGINFQHERTSRHCAGDLVHLGPAILHGPHHAAQKSIRTGTFALLTTSSNIASSTSTGSLRGPSSVLHFPQRTFAASCPPRTRFFWPHALHVRIISHLYPTG